MNLYLVFEVLLIALLLGLSLRLVWQQLLKPALQKPKAACSRGGCNKCGSQS